MSDNSARARGRGLVTLGCAGAFALVLAYLALVLTPSGQRFDDSAYLARLEVAKRGRSAISELLGTVSIGTMIVMGLILLIVAMRRHRLIVALVALGCFAFADITAELLKRLLPHPELNAIEGLMGTKEGLGTYPSGHATIATGFVLALVFVSAARWRPAVGLIGALWASTISIGLLAAGWHRPSDTLGGIGLACAYFGIGCGLFLRSHYSYVRPSTGIRLLLPGALVVWLLTGAVLGVSLLRGAQRDLNSAISPWAFPLACLGIGAASVAATVMFTWLMRDSQLDLNKSESPRLRA